MLRITVRGPAEGRWRGRSPSARAFATLAAESVRGRRESWERLRRTFATRTEARRGERLVACLDAMNRLDAFMSYKARSWELVVARGARRILDAACGVGFDVIEMAERRPDARFVGADMSERFLRLARARATGLANVEFVRADARRLPFPDASFDAARIDRSFQHIEGPEAAMRELQRVVRPGGRIVACEPDWGAFFLRGVDDTLDAIIAARFASLFVNPRIGNGNWEYGL